MSESSVAVRALKAYGDKLRGLLSKGEMLIERAEHCERTQQPNLANLYWRRAEEVIAEAEDLMGEGKVAA